MTGQDAAIGEVLAALAYGERLAQRRAEDAVDLAPDPETRVQQRAIADREQASLRLLEARLAEVGAEHQLERFRPFFDAFFAATVPNDWLEAQAFHYVGDALVADFAESLLPSLDAVTAEVVKRALTERDDQGAFALDQLTNGIEGDEAATERIAAYARTVAGEALTQTRRALDEAEALSALLGGEEGQKRVLLDLLDRHRRRLDRLGIEPVEPD